MCRSRLLHLVVFVSALAHGGCGGGGTLTGAGGNTGMGTGSGGLGNSPGTQCGAEGPARLLAPDIVIALDASSTMNDDLGNVACAGGCGQSSKWAAASGAINSVVANTASRVDWGLTFFGVGSVVACGTNTGIYADTAPDSGGQIDLALRGQTTPDGGVYGAGARQTRGAVETAHAYLTTSGAPGSKFIVVITDGAPRCAADGTSITDDTPATVGAISAAAAAGVPTFVVGIRTGTGQADTSLIMMASAGRDGPTGGIGSYVSTEADIAGALRWVADRTAGCTFEVPEESADGTLRRANIGVKVNGTEIVRDAGRTNGWDYVDATMTSVRIHGDACAAAKAAGPGAVTIHFKCVPI